MNKVIMNGYLVKDMEVRTTKSSCVANLTIANKEGFGDYEHTSFINCTMFGEKRISALEKYLLKGCKVLITGRWKQDSYEHNEGHNVYTHELLVDDLEIERFVVEDEEEEEINNKKNKKSSNSNKRKR